MEQGKREVGTHPGFMARAHVSMMARPWILIRRVHHLGPDRIQVDVSQQFKQVLISVYENRVIALLEQVPRRM